MYSSDSKTRMFVPTEYIFMFRSIFGFDQSSNFFHQLYIYSKKILYETQQNIYIFRISSTRSKQNGVKILLKFFSS